MVLLNDFFKIISTEKQDQSYQVTVELNPAHEIFNGHFPGNPVVPGVCMVQMVKEILQQLSGKNLTMVQANQLKFLTILNPVSNPLIQLKILIGNFDESSMSVSGSIQKDEIIFLKYKAVFSILHAVFF